MIYLDSRSPSLFYRKNYLNTDFIKIDNHQRSQFVVVLT